MDALFDTPPPVHRIPPRARLADQIEPLGRAKATRLAAKSAFDRSAAAIGLILLAPLLLLLALAVRLDSRGPALFRQMRHGLHGQAFAILKFRTMAWLSAAPDGQIQAARGDCRVTRVGALLRRTSLDELPQLWNVLTGTMALVGPRPHPVAMRTAGKLCEEIVADYADRHRMRPGLTGLAQINGHRGATASPDALQARLADDLLYIRTWSLSLDLRIILLTPIRLFTHRDAAF